MSMIKIYTDGSCIKNPGPGGWAALIKYKNKKKIFSGNKTKTTNNQMELIAAIKGLEILKTSSNVELVTDSIYLKKGIMYWVYKWRKFNWIRSNKKPVKNKELWEKLFKLSKFHNVKWMWIKGHSGNLNNEMVDLIAKKEAKKILNLK